MTQIIEINTKNPWWKIDIDKAVDDFKVIYGVTPHMIVGNNFVNAINETVKWISADEVTKEKSMMGFYQGTPVEIDPDINCVILKA